MSPSWPAFLLLVALTGGGCERAVSSDSEGEAARLKGTIVTKAVIKPGSAIVLEGPSPAGSLAAVFEDDGDTGYFYALETDRLDNPIVDALHVYNAATFADRGKATEAAILWSADGKKAALLINGYPHAVFDFEAKRGYCRTGFPPADKRWSGHQHNWSESALQHFQ
jgi:hypothetical protein